MVKERPLPGNFENVTLSSLLNLSMLWVLFTSAFLLLTSAFYALALSINGNCGLSSGTLSS